MIDKKRIVCFFTAGYTELNSMKLFLKKINNNVEYIQRCPNGPRKSKEAIKNRRIGNIIDKQSGLTGQALISYLLNYIDEPQFIEEQYDAILIEDDKDDRFLRIRPDGTADIDKAAWEQHKDLVRTQVHAKCPHIPVIFFYAAPEVESWFLADWDNSFGDAYKNIFSDSQNNYFKIVFHNYVLNSILTRQYSKCPESYGYFNGVYKKLSTEIQSALQTTDFLKDYMCGTDHKIAHYSKRIHGEIMLENIDPQIVLRNCTYFFKSGLYELQTL